VIKLNFFVRTNNWSRRLKRAKLTANKVLKQKLELRFNSNIDYYLNIILMNDKEMKKLNYKYKKINKTTDILTFVSKYKNYKNDIIKYCDIFISAEMIKQYSKKNNIDFYDHFTHLLIHSFLHINGYLHKKINDYKNMQKAEIKILNKIGLKNPYLY